MKFLEPTRKPKVIFTDKSLEFGKSCEESSWNHCTSTPHRLETNAVEIRSGQWMLGGFHGMSLLSANCSASFIWWEITTWKAVRNAVWRTSNIVWSNGRISPYLCKRQSRLHQFGSKVLPGIFRGYALNAGRIWKGELEQVEASEIHARRLNAMEVLTPLRSGNFIFPFADGTVKISGGDQRLRTSTLIRDRPERGVEQENHRGESDGLCPRTPHQDDSTVDDAEAKNDFWSIAGDFICRHHVELRVKLYVPREESFLTLLKYIDVSRNTHTALDVMLEKNIDDYWNVDGDREFSDMCTGFTRFTSLNERQPDGYTLFGERLTWKQTTSRPDIVWPDMWKHMLDTSKRKEKQEWAIEKPKLDNARRLRLIQVMRNSSESWRTLVEN